MEVPADRGEHRENMIRVLGKPVKVFHKENDTIKRGIAEKDSLNLFEHMYTRPGTSKLASPMTSQ